MLETDKIFILPLSKCENRNLHIKISKVETASTKYQFNRLMGRPNNLVNRIMVKPNNLVNRIFGRPNNSVDQIIWFSTEYQIMIFGYKPNINYLQIIFG